MFENIVAIGIGILVLYWLTIYSVKRQKKEYKDVYDRSIQKQEEVVQLLKEIRDLLKDQKKN